LIEVKRRDGRGRICVTDAGTTPAVAVHVDGSDTLDPVMERLTVPVFSLPAGGLPAVLDPSGGPTALEVLPGVHAAAYLPRPDRDPAGFASALVGIRDRIGPDAVLYAPHVATPHIVPLLVYMGVDLIDPYEVVNTSLRGWRYTPYTLLPSEEDCLADNVGLLGDIVEETVRAVRGNYLRELVEATSSLSNSGVSILRALDHDHYAAFEAHAPVHRRARMLARDSSLLRPEVVRFRERVLGRFEPLPYRYLLLLPCSAVKPYSRSKSHRRFIETLQTSGRGRSFQELVLTSPLGVVPRELERFYPASGYDIPVTGHWSADERAMMVDMLERFLSGREYDAIIAHLPGDLSFLKECVPDAVWTVDGGPASASSLESLGSALSGLDPSPVRDIRRATTRSAIAFQFGSSGWAEPFEVRGREVVSDGTILRWSDRYVLTMEGGRRLAEAGIHTVEIDDFTPKGSVLAPGVLGCRPGVRPGDEVAAVHDGEVRAVGTAVMCADEMIASGRGVAVKVRDHL